MCHEYQGHLDAKASRRILELAKQQQEEEAGVDEDVDDTSAIAGPSRLPAMDTTEDVELSEEEEYEEEDFGDEEYEEIVRTVPFFFALEILVDTNLTSYFRKLTKVTKLF